MVINEDNIQFIAFVTNDPDDKSPIVLNLHHGIVWVIHCDEHKHVGSIFTCDSKVSSPTLKHTIARTKGVNKLMIFLEANKDALFEVKKTVVDACFNASLLYGSEGGCSITKPNFEQYVHESNQYAAWCTPIHP